MKKLICLTIVALFLSSCSKEEDTSTYPFVVQVVGENNIPIQNAKVVASAPISESRAKFEGYTDVNGEVRFEYDFEAVLQIVAIKGSPPLYEGCAFIKLEENQTITQKVYMFTYDPQNPGCI